MSLRKIGHKLVILLFVAGACIGLGAEYSVAIASNLVGQEKTSASSEYSQGVANLAAMAKKLSFTSSGGSLPSITKAADGTVVVAWQQNVPYKTIVQQEIFARSSGDGVNFTPAASAASNVSNTTTNSREPYLLNLSGGGVEVFYEDLPSNIKTWQIMSSTWNSGTWSAPLRMTTQATWTYQDPVAVQATDGTIWFATQTYFGNATWTDTVVQQVGGSGLFYNLSKDGSAVRRPAIAAGDNGQVFAGWLDHANERGRPPTPGPGFKVQQWTGSIWTILPDPTNEGYNGFPALAYHNGLLYAAWPSAVGTLGIKEKTWDGLKWSAMNLLAPSSGARNLRLIVSQMGNIFITWDSGGIVYLQKNKNKPIILSTGVPRAQQPALFVDENDVAYVAFQNGAIWYKTVP